MNSNRDVFNHNVYNNNIDRNMIDYNETPKINPKYT